MQSVVILQSPAKKMRKLYARRLRHLQTESKHFHLPMLLLWYMGDGYTCKIYTELRIALNVVMSYMHKTLISALTAEQRWIGGKGMWTLVNYILEAVILDAVISFILATIITIVYMAILD